MDVHLFFIRKICLYDLLLSVYFILIVYQNSNRKYGKPCASLLGLASNLESLNLISQSNETLITQYY